MFIAMRVSVRRAGGKRRGGTALVGGGVDFLGGSRFSALPDISGLLKTRGQGRENRLCVSLAGCLPTRTCPNP
jgi:hypothetical protein